MKIVTKTWSEIYEKIQLKLSLYSGCTLYGVPRGGAIVAGLAATGLTDNTATSVIEDATVIVDDVVDSGRTRHKYNERFPDKNFVALYDKKENDVWIQFPWEHEDHLKDAEDSVVRIMQYIGFPPTTEGRLNTPARYLRALKELTSSSEDLSKPTTFSSTPDDVWEIVNFTPYDQMIVDRNIQFYSLCEHHMIPFFGSAKIAYIPKDRIIGLSKLSRILRHFAARLNTQEYLTQQVTEFLQERLQPKGVGVVITARHLCREMRGAKTQGEMVTSCMKGVFLDDVNTRQEFLNL